MLSRFVLPILASAVVLSSGFAEAKSYTNAKQAALRQGAYRFSRNNVVRNTLGTMNRRRVTSKYLGKTNAGNPRYMVRTRKHLNGAPVTTTVTVRQLNSGQWKPYSGRKINYARAQKNSSLYHSGKTAALRQGAYRFSRSNFVRNQLGVIDRRRVTSKKIGTTAAGNDQYLVKTRKHLNGKPVSTVVTVKQLVSGMFMPYKGKRINYTK